MRTFCSADEESRANGCSCGMGATDFIKEVDTLGGDSKTELLKMGGRKHGSKKSL